LQTVLRCISYPLDAEEPISFHHSLSPAAASQETLLNFFFRLKRGFVKPRLHFMLSPLTRSGDFRGRFVAPHGSFYKASVDAILLHCITCKQASQDLQVKLPRMFFTATIE
jgi:hypothetical protein